MHVTQTQLAAPPWNVNFVLGPVHAKVSLKITNVHANQGYLAASLWNVNCVACLSKAKLLSQATKVIATKIRR